MQAVVIYESLTGNTRRAAVLIGAALQRAGVPATVCPVGRVDLQALSAADLVIVGSWTDGFVFFGQRPGRSARLRGLPVMHGKKAAVFCTYAIDQGRALDKLADIVRERGADVLGGMAIRRDDIDGGVRDFVDRLLDVVAPA